MRFDLKMTEKYFKGLFIYYVTRLGGKGVGGFVAVCYVGEGGSEPLLRNEKKCQRTKRHVRGKG